MSGYNHYSNCPCPWCVGYGRASGFPKFDAAGANARVIADQLGFKRGSYASCFVNPNARCPVCQARVFFYANAAGSRVFFDDLGPPWPKHGCTDRGRSYAIREPARDFPNMSRRAQGEIDELCSSLALMDEDPRSGRQHAPVSVFEVLESFRVGFSTLVRARALVGSRSEVWVEFTSAKATIHAADIFSFDGESLTFPDLEAGFQRTFKARIVSNEEAEIVRAARG